MGGLPTGFGGLRNPCFAWCGACMCACAGVCCTRHGAHVHVRAFVCAGNLHIYMAHTRRVLCPSFRSLHTHLMHTTHSPCHISTRGYFCNSTAGLHTGTCRSPLPFASPPAQVTDKVDDLLKLLSSCPDEATKTLTCLTLATRMVSQCDSQVGWGGVWAGRGGAWAGAGWGGMGFGRAGPTQNTAGLTSCPLPLGSRVQVLGSWR